MNSVDFIRLSCIAFLTIPAPLLTQETEPEEEPVVQPTANPTALQIGVVQNDAPRLPEGSEDLAKEAALAAADREWDKAREIYLKILKMDESNPLTLSNLGAVEFRVGNLEKAVAYLDAATREAPSIAQNWLTLGLIYYRQSNSNMAISCLSRALAEDPGDPRAHNYLAVAIRERGWVIGAETELQRAIILDPGYADAHFNLAVMYVEKTPPSIELARRHYYAALDYGAKPDETIAAKLNPKKPAAAETGDESESSESNETETETEP
ncbi:MAG: tetratricopeptide repeat protein [Verrucomicrobiota bacterium]